MKKYYRFMGQEEFDYMIEGKTLENHTEWNAGKGIPKTSIGFCFFDNLVPPEKRLAYAFGAMHELNPICVMFKPAKGTFFREGWGIYAKPLPNLWSRNLMLNSQNTLLVREYSLEWYSRESMMPVAFGKPRHGESEYEWHIDWKPITDYGKTEKDGMHLHQ